MGLVAAAGNLSMKGMRRLLSAHKPLQRRAQRRAREREVEAIVRRALAVEDELATVAAGRCPIIAGPWLAEVGYEVLYWLPFLRWFQREYRVDPARIVAFSRGGVEHWYRDVAGRYADIFDHLSPEELSSLNESRQHAEEGGGRKQFAAGGPLEERLLAAARGRNGLEDGRVLLPSLMFRLFRDVWHGNLALEFLWNRTRYTRLGLPPRPSFPGLPPEYVAVKLYTGTALPDAPAQRELVRDLVARTAEQIPVVALETGLSVDDHADFGLAGLPNVISARDWMTPRTNLGVQSALIAHGRRFVGTCGGLAWLAPFMGVPTVAVYADDSLLAPHLLVARQAGQKAGAAAFSPVDLRAWSQLRCQPGDDANYELE
jgi:hypothetical protein